MRPDQLERRLRERLTRSARPLAPDLSSVRLRGDRPREPGSAGRPSESPITSTLGRRLTSSHVATVGSREYEPISHRKLRSKC